MGVSGEAPRSVGPLVRVKMGPEGCLSHFPGSVPPYLTSQMLLFLLSKCHLSYDDVEAATIMN